MNEYIFLDEIETAAATIEETIAKTDSPIPAREATVKESLQLIGEGWASIFVVILIIIGVTMLLNRVFSKKK